MKYNRFDDAARSGAYKPGQDVGISLLKEEHKLKALKQVY